MMMMKSLQKLKKQVKRVKSTQNECINISTFEHYLLFSSTFNISHFFVKVSIAVQGTRRCSRYVLLIICWDSRSFFISQATSNTSMTLRRTQKARNHLQKRLFSTRLTLCEVIDVKLVTMDFGEEEFRLTLDAGVRYLKAWGVASSSSSLALLMPIWLTLSFIVTSPSRRFSQPPLPPLPPGPREIMFGGGGGGLRFDTVDRIAAPSRDTTEWLNLDRAISCWFCCGLWCILLFICIEYGLLFSAEVRKLLFGLRK